jgi:hypothetical protein
MPRRRFLAPVLLAALAACEGTGPNELDFAVEETNPPVNFIETASVAAADGAIAVEGAISGSLDCVEFGSAVDRTGGDVSVRVFTVDRGEPCAADADEARARPSASAAVPEPEAAVVRVLRFSGRVPDLAPGTYTARVIRTVPGNAALADTLVVESVTLSQ